MSKQTPDRLLAHSTIIACADEKMREQTARQVIAEILGVSATTVPSQPNVIWLAPERSYGREEVMRVVHELSMTTFDEGAARCVVFTDAHRLTSEAANALLKLIEEPPQEVYFFLLAATVAHILPTLRSRSQVMAFAAQEPPEDADARAFFANEIPARFAQIAGLSDRNAMLKLYDGLLLESARTRNYEAASWLLEYANYAHASGNVRLLLETAALKIGEAT